MEINTEMLLAASKNKVNVIIEDHIPRQTPSNNVNINQDKSPNHVLRQNQDNSTLGLAKQDNISSKENSIHVEANVYLNNMQNM